MSKMLFRIGEATLPQGAGHKIIAHFCNDQGLWGKGLPQAISRRWQSPERQYRSWYAGRAYNDFEIGQVQLVQVGSFIHVANMVAELRGVAAAEDSALETCLARLRVAAAGLRASIHLQRQGMLGSGPKWTQIEPLLLQHLADKGIQVVVYDHAA